MIKERAKTFQENIEVFDITGTFQKVVFNVESSSEDESSSDDA